MERVFEILRRVNRPGTEAVINYMKDSFRMDWLDLLAVQGTLKSLLQHHSSKASILQHSALFIVQLSHPIHDHWKNHSLD